MFIEPLIASVIGNSLLTVPVAINIISSSATTIYGLIESISNSNTIYSTDINEFIISSDIKVKLEIYTLLLSEIKDLEIKTIILCINKIHDSITNIKNELIEIETNIKYNESLYIAKKWRSYSFKLNIDKLKIYVKLLDDRFIALRNACGIISLLGIIKAH